MFGPVRGHGWARLTPLADRLGVIHYLDVLAKPNNRTSSTSAPGPAFPKFLGPYFKGGPRAVNALPARSEPLTDTGI
jgi:hypothetical protein